MKSRNHTVQLLRDLLGFMLAHKKWWLVPMMVVTLLLVTLVVLGSSPAAPFIYTVF
jgi:hypothetical protein